MKKIFTFLFFILTVTTYIGAQSTLEGTIREKESKEGISGVIKLFKNGAMINGTQTDVEGNYVLTNIDNGTYDIEASGIGYTPERKIKVVLAGGKITRLDFGLNKEGVILEGVVITDYKAPLIDIDNTTAGTTVTAEKIQNLPTKNIVAIAALTAGVSTINGKDINMRGGRTSGTGYYIDGIRVNSGNLIPQSEIDQMQVITGGLEAKYGDATGGLISLTTKGPSQKVQGGIEAETSQYLDPYGYNLLSAYVSGPIWKRKGVSVLGYRLSSQYKYVKDDDPGALGYNYLNQDLVSNLENSPTQIYKGTLIPSALFLADSMVTNDKAARNEQSKGLDLNAKIDARINKNFDISLTGSYKDQNQRYRPQTNDNTSSYSGKSWSLLNYENNPYYYENSYRFNFKIRQKFGKQGLESSTENGENKGGMMLRNIYYTLNLAYEKYKTRTEDIKHKNNLFEYGYYGSQGIKYDSVVDVVDTSTWHGRGKVFNNGRFYDFVGYNFNLSDFVANDKVNPILARYNFINGDVDKNFFRLWSNLYLNVGQVFNSFSKSDEDRYTGNLAIGFDFLPNGSKSGRHNIEIGAITDMRVYRNYNIQPRQLWELAHLQENIWIVGVDTTDVVGNFDYEVNGTVYNFLKYNTKLNRNEDSRFYKQIRQLLGKNEHQYVSVDEEVTPDKLSLDMFSGKELNDNRILGYYGYDYLGNKLSLNAKFDDFFKTNTSSDGTITQSQSKKDFWSPAFNPLYGGIYIQDRFSFKDVIMRLGARVDYYDANTKVLKDPYSLYDIMDAKEFYALNIHKDLVRPSSIGDDYKVYVSDEKSEDIIGYRKGDQWYLPNGTATEGGTIFQGGLVYPYYKERRDTVRNIQSNLFTPDVSFKDYTPQWNFMPRISFSFPISEDAGFFAHYDVLVQRPSNGTSIMTPMDYYYFASSGTQTYDNPNLKPEKTIDYEVGFQQKLTNNSALKIQSYYREQRDMIRLRPYFFVPYVSKYNTYGNLDYGTVKGFSFTYDYRRSGNLEFQVAYTLQFANGTGSDVNSADGLINRGIIRNLYSTSFDERHRLAVVVDYRYFSGKMYNGPELFGLKIFENAGANLQINAVSGRPYTKNSQPDAFGGSGYEGAINGSRKPWYFEAGLKLDKSFKLYKSLEGNIYFRVENLLNTKNIINVYPYTGDPDDDGYLLSTLGQSKVNNIKNQGLPIQNFYQMYGWYLDENGNYSRPRRLYLGITFNF